MLLWELTYGEKRKFFEGLERETGKTPRPLRLRPTLHPHLSFAWELFWELRDDCRSEWGIQRVTLTQIRDALDLCGLTDADTRLWLKRLVRGLDDTYLQEVRRRQKKPETPTTSQPSPPAKR